MGKVKKNRKSKAGTPGKAGKKGKPEGKPKEVTQNEDVVKKRTAIAAAPRGAGGILLYRGHTDGSPRGAVSAEGSAPSNHAATAAGLAQRGIVLDVTWKLDNQRIELEARIDAFRRACISAPAAAAPAVPPVPATTQSSMELSTVKQAFSMALSKMYPPGIGKGEGETAFDKELFSALGVCLKDYAKIVTLTVPAAGAKSSKQKGQGANKRIRIASPRPSRKGGNGQPEPLTIIVLNNHWTLNDKTYAVGFSRQVTTKMLGIPESFGCAKSSRHDHTCVLLEKGVYDDNAKFVIVEASATVGLKTVEHACTLEKRNNGKVQNKDSDGPLVQVVAYTASDVWPCVARRGMTMTSAKGANNDSVPNQIAFGILACNLQDKKKKEDDKLKTKAGNRESGSSTATSTRTDVDTEPTSLAGKATYSKRSRWLFGSLAIPEICCERFMYRVHSFGTFQEPTEGILDDGTDQTIGAYLAVMTSGMELLNSLRKVVQFKSHPLSGRALKFGDAILDMKYHASPFSDCPPEGGRKRISQGEFWRTTMRKKEFKKLITELKEEENKKGYNIFVMDDDNDDDDDEDVPLLVKGTCIPIFNSLIHPERSFQALTMMKDLFKGVLVACDAKDHGMVTIMHDLSPAGYQDLAPASLLQEIKKNLHYLWNEFAIMVRRQLIPLAQERIIHADIRPGYDWTANIIVDESGEQMQLIDLESLVIAGRYDAPQKDKRYIPAWSGAFVFLAAQCLAVAVSWSEQWFQQDKDDDKAMNPLWQDNEDSLQAFNTQKHIDLLLRKISEQFANTESLDVQRLLKDMQQN